MAKPNIVLKEPGSRPGTFFFHLNDGFYYHHQTTIADRSFYKCVRSAEGCKGRAVSGRDGHFQHTVAHTHAADPYYRLEIAERNAILKTCEDLPNKPIQEIINELFPMELRPSFASMRESMGKRQASMRRHQD